jgi:hypothetical protein
MLCITVNARADVVVPGTKTIEYCAQFTGIPDFPNYVFLAIDPGGNSQRVDPNSCLSFNRNFNLTFGAVKVSDYSLAEKYKVGDSRFIPANLGLGMNRSNTQAKYIEELRVVKQDVPLTKVVDLLKVAEVGDREVKLEKDSVIYSYTNGVTERLPYLDQSTRPAYRQSPPSSNGSSTTVASTSAESGFSWWWALVIPALALVAIALLVWQRGRARR